MTIVTKRPPYEAYAAIMGSFLGGVGLAGLAARRFDRNPACQTPLDYVVLSMASFKAARTLAGQIANRGVAFALGCPQAL